MTQPAYYVVAAFRCHPLLLDRDQLERQVGEMIRATCNDVEGLTVHIREDKPPRKGKVTSGAWGNDGV